ncbi:MAG TPA: GTP-binding protein, partial [Candidatus Cloacimonas sp.]|nr:GTP-binding protein [Candidatus Cloacimonas sp.]
MGRIEEGNTIMDFDPEEIAKKMSLGLSIGYVQYLDHKINILDTPGCPDFVGDAIVALPAVENALIVANATGGYEVGLELALEQIEERKMGKIIVVNRMDNDNADYDKTLEAIAENTDLKPVKIHLPIGKEGAFEGVVDIIKRKAIKAGKESEIPANIVETMEEARIHLMEAVAETDEDLLNEYLENMELPEDKLIEGLKKGILSGEISP